MINDEGIDLATFDKDKEIAKFDTMMPVGWTIVVRLYITPTKTKGGIFLTDKIQDDQQYNSCVGLVVAKSKGAYLDKRYEDTGVWCEKGDWVIFPRHAGYKILYDGMPVFILKEDAVDVKIPDPTKVTK